METILFKTNLSTSDPAYVKIHGDLNFDVGNGLYMFSNAFCKTEDVSPMSGDDRIINLTCVCCDENSNDTMCEF